MNDHEMEPGTLCFRCNICGQQGVTDVDLLRREKPTCAGCGSTPRARAIIGALSRELLGEDLGLWEFPERKEIVGLGTADWEGYATGLAEKFRYKNTYYHQEPHFDIAAAEISSSILESCDFVVSSEVFEHVIPPVSRAFENAWKILRPGGLFLLTVPYGSQVETIEHFPSLNDFSLTQEEGVFRLRNVTKDGQVEEFDRLIFHGGPGATLEMRVFAETAIVRHLREAGFEAIKIHRKPDFRSGIWWPEPWSFPISARKSAG